MKLKIASLCTILVLLVLAAPMSVSSAAEGLPRVVIVSTGGTIASTAEEGGAVPAVTGQALIDAVPELSQIARVEVIDLCRIDSSQMTPQIWAELSRTLDRALADPQIVGAVVTHGTDTMAQAAFFLDSTLVSDKTVVLTGAMRSASEPGAEGPANLLAAVITAVSPPVPGLGRGGLPQRLRPFGPLRPKGPQHQRPGLRFRAARLPGPGVRGAAPALGRPSPASAPAPWRFPAFNSADRHLCRRRTAA